MKICNNFKKNYPLKLKFIKKHKADILKTHGNNLKIKKYLGIKKFTNFDKKYIQLFNLYKKYKIYKY